MIEPQTRPGNASFVKSWISKPNIIYKEAFFSLWYSSKLGRKMDFSDRTWFPSKEPISLFRQFQDVCHWIQGITRYKSDTYFLRFFGNFRKKVFGEKTANKQIHEKYQEIKRMTIFWLEGLFLKFLQRIRRIYIYKSIQSHNEPKIINNKKHIRTLQVIWSNFAKI